MFLLQEQSWFPITIVVVGEALWAAGVGDGGSN